MSIIKISDFDISSSESRYIINKKIMLGSGGYGEVYSAYDKKTNKDICVKIEKLKDSKSKSQLEKEKNNIIAIRKKNKNIKI